MKGQGVVEVKGSYAYSGGSIELDLGILSENSESCRALGLSGVQRGSAPMRLERLQDIPYEHRLELRDRSAAIVAGGSPKLVNESESLNLCLVTGNRRLHPPLRDNPG